VCFFSDGLVEARSADGLLGRERLREIFDGLGSGPAAEDLLGGVRAAACSTPDDMAACVLTPLAGRGGVDGGRGCAQVEELEAGAGELEGAPVRAFLAACGVPAARIEQAIVRARRIAAEHETALLRVELGAVAAEVEVVPPELGVAAPGPGHERQPMAQPLLRTLSAI
jgi:hypothetical protein